MKNTFWRSRIYLFFRHLATTSALLSKTPKLLNDSVEKEKLQRELKLARDMEAKLLPQVLPEI
jgi:hypothetical protein